MNVTFLFFMVSFYSCFTKKVDEYNFTSIFMFSSGRQFFSSRFSFFTSSYNFEVNLQEKVDQKIEKACWAKYGEGKQGGKKGPRGKRKIWWKIVFINFFCNTRVKTEHKEQKSYIHYSSFFFHGCSLIFSCLGHITIFPVFSAQKCF